MKSTVLVILLIGFSGCFIHVSGIKCYDCRWVNSTDPEIRKGVNHQDHCLDEPSKGGTASSEVTPEGIPYCVDSKGTYKDKYTLLTRDVRWKGDNNHNGKCENYTSSSHTGSQLNITTKDVTSCYCSSDLCNTGKFGLVQLETSTAVNNNNNDKNNKNSAHVLQFNVIFLALVPFETAFLGFSNPC